LLSIKHMKVLLAAAVAAMAIGAVGASPASATIVSAKFSTSSEFNIKAAGVTIKKNGGSAKSCNLTAKGSEFGSGSFIGTSGTMHVTFTCAGSPSLKVYFFGQMKYDTVTGRYWLQLANGQTSLESPWGWYTQTSNQWTWVNGSGGTPSTIPLEEQYVGYVNGSNEKITISGTLTATTLAGGLITLTH
jgi:hypothetical protein